MTPAGKRDWKITIQRKTVTNDSLNEPIETWADYISDVWAARETLSATEKLALQEISAEQTLRFKVLYSAHMASVRATDRLVSEGRIFAILGVEETERRAELTITATARAE